MKYLLCFLLGTLWNPSSAVPPTPASTDLPVLQWKNARCTAGVNNCAEVEFCVPEPNKYAFRLPGAPCIPGRGPLIRMSPGGTYQLTLRNVANSGIERYATAIHTHGLHISPEGSSDNMTRYVAPGRCMTYNWVIPSDHMGGTYWYYATKHPDTQIQIHGGAFGMIIIEDQPDLLSAAPPSFKAWQSNELLLLASKLEEEPSPYYFVDLYLGNGFEEAVYSMNAGEWYRLRVVGMEAGGRPGVLAFTGCDVHAVAVDGIWFFSVPFNTAPQLSYDMISRMDFAIKCPAGTYDITFFGGKVATLNVGSSPVTSGSNPFPTLPWRPNRPAYLQDLQAYSGPVKNFTFHLIDGYINNASWSATTPLVNLSLGDVVEWTLKGTTTAPFHIQSYSLQVISEDGTCGWHKKGEYYDVISAASGDVGVQIANHAVEAPEGPPCTVRALLKDVGGRVVFLTQYLELSDGGTRGWANVSGAPAVDTSLLTAERCTTVDCVPDGTCTPEFECGSYYGRTNCGGPCNLNATSIPKCPTRKPYCDTMDYRCMRKPKVLRAVQQSIKKATTVTAPSTTLLSVPWKSTGCHAGYDFCGEMEFCAVDNGITEYAYRLPGMPCRPAKSPVIRMTPGKKFMLTLHNRGVPGVHEHTCNLHTHGIHVRGDGNTDDITRLCHAGNSLRFTYDIPAYHQGGTFWYHDHVHELTKPHVAGGAFGMLLLDDPADFAPDTEPNYANFRLWLKNEVPLIASRVGDIYLGNGNVNEQLYLMADEWYRLRIVGVDPEAKPKDLIVGNANCEVHRMQHDGVWNTLLPANVVSDNTWTMSGASRVEMAVRCRAGTYPIWWFGGQVASLVVTPGTPTMADPWIKGYGMQWNVEGRRPEYLRSLMDYNGPMDKYVFTIKHGYINDIKYDEHVPMTAFEHGRIVEFTFRGTSIHAFHLHIWHMQVVTPGGCGYHQEGQWYDVIANDAGGNCTVRVPLFDHSGRTTLHCHYLEHEDIGTMTWLNVTGGPPPDMYEVAEFPTPDIYTPSISGDIAIYKGPEPLGNAHLEMAGQILAITANTTRFTQWKYTSIAVYAGVGAVPTTATGEPDLAKFQFRRNESLGVTEYTFSADIATFGVTCPSSYPATINVAVRVEAVNMLGETFVGWALGKRFSNNPDATAFKFTPSCTAPAMEPIMMLSGVASVGRAYSVQLDPSSISLSSSTTIAAAGPSAPSSFALVPASATGTFNCIGAQSAGPVTSSVDQRGLVLKVPAQASGVYGVCLLNPGQAAKATKATLTVTGPATALARGAECLASSEPQQVQESENLALQVAGVQLHPTDVWWVVEAGAGCQAGAAPGNVRSGPSASASVRGLSGQLTLCYQHQGVVVEIPLCVNVNRDTPSNESASIVLYVVPAVVGACLLLAAVVGICWFRSRRHRQNEAFLAYQDKDVEASCFPEANAGAPTMLVTPGHQSASTLVSPAPIRLLEEALGGHTPSQRLNPSANDTPRVNREV